MMHGAAVEPVLCAGGPRIDAGSGGHGGRQGAEVHRNSFASVSGHAHFGSGTTRSVAAPDDRQVTPSQAHRMPRWRLASGGDRGQTRLHLRRE